MTLRRPASDSDLLLRFSRPRGFTLIELLVVMAIAAMLVAVTPPLISRALPGVELKGAARQLSAALRFARNRAVTVRESVAVQVDVEQRRITVAGRPKPIQLSERLEVKMLTAESESQGEQVGGIRFFPDGGSTGGRVTFIRNERETAVDVDWLTGRVRIIEHEEE